MMLQLIGVMATLVVGHTEITNMQDQQSIAEKKTLTCPDKQICQHLTPGLR